MTVTIKYNKGYEAPWVVFHGTPEAIRADIIATFGMDAAEVETLTLHELTLNATSAAHGAYEAKSQLGGRAIGGGKSSGSSSSAPSAPASAPAPVKEEAHPLLAMIADVPSVAALQTLWARNKAEFAKPELMDAYKARGQKLTEEGKLK